jgi:hypothetical protein
VRERKSFRRVLVSLAVAASALFIPAVPASAHGTCTVGVSGWRFYAGGDYYAAGARCDYNHAKMVLTGWEQKWNGSSWVKSNSAVSKEEYNERWLPEMRIPATILCVQGVRYRGHVDSLKVYTSSGALVHIIYNVNGPYYMC